MNKGRTKVGDFFVSYGWACVCIIVASVVLFEVGIRSMNAVKDHEKINYFIECYGIEENNTLTEDTANTLKEDGIVESHLYHVGPNDALKNTQFQTHGLFSDICLLFESEIVGFKEIIGEYFVAWDETFKEGCDFLTEGEEFYEAYSQAWGLKVFDPDQHTNWEFSSLCSFEKEGEKSEDVYLFIPNRSPNFSSPTSVGFKALNYFLERYAK